ncbi:hypothetical protein KKB18_13805 [bacterium]|nr:hypothetical protein [bacterium]
MSLICPFCSVQITEDENYSSSDFYECPSCHKIVDLQSLSKTIREDSVETFMKIEKLEKSEKLRNVTFVVGISIFVLSIIVFWIYYLSTH